MTVAVGSVFGIDGVAFELIQAEIVEHEVGHRLVQIAEKKHLAQQVFIAVLQL